MRTFTILLVLIFIYFPFSASESIVLNDKHGDVFNSYLYQGLNQYKHILSYRESSNNPKAIGRNYYKGLYSIGKSTAKDIGVCYDSLFIPSYSDESLVKLMRYNDRLLKSCRYIDKKGNTRITLDYYLYVNKTIKGIKVTKAGLLAGCHLKGHIWVKIWLKSNGEIDAKDANGVKVSSYIKMMENVELIKF